MLKHIILNQKKVPVPIPIKNLDEAVNWVEKHLLRPDHSITKISIDGKEVEILDQNHSFLDVRLSEESIVELRIDSPTEISIQTVDALRNLALALERSLKPMAVKCWQFSGQEDPIDFATLCGDVDLILDLIDHVIVLLDRRISLANIKMIHDKISQGAIALQMAINDKNWRSVAKIILQQLEASIIELNNELCMIQKSIFESMADRPKQASKV